MKVFLNSRLQLAPGHLARAMPRHHQGLALKPLRATGEEGEAPAPAAAAAPEAAAPPSGAPRRERRPRGPPPGAGPAGPAGDGANRERRPRPPRGPPVKKNSSKSTVLISWIKNETSQESFAAMVNREGEIERWNAPECDCALRQIANILQSRRLSDWPEAPAIFAALAERVLSSPKSQVRHLVTIPYVAARIALPEGAEWFRRADDVIVELLEQPEARPLQPVEAASLFFASGTFRVEPSPVVLDAIVKLAPQMTDIRGICSILSGMAKLGKKEAFESFAESTAFAVQAAAIDPNSIMDSRSVSNLFHAHAQSDVPIKPSLAEALLRRLGDLSASRDTSVQPNMTQSAITMWSLGKVGMKAEFEQAEAILTPVMLRHLIAGRATEQNVSNILISASNLGVSLQKPLLKQLLTNFKSKSGDCSAQAIANTLNALANWNLTDEFKDLSESLGPLMARFDTLPMANAQAASTVLWSHAACLIELDESSKAAVLRALEAGVTKANTRDIPYTLYAFSIMDYPIGESLGGALLDRALQLRNARTWSTQELCVGIYSLAVLGAVVAPSMREDARYWEVLTALHERLSKLKDPDYKPIDYSMIVQAWLLVEAIPGSAEKIDKRFLISKDLWDTAVEARLQSLAAVRRDRGDFVSQVAADLQEVVGVAPGSEVPVGSGGLLLADLVVQVGEDKVVVEADGPSHFTDKRRRTGPTRARDLLIAQSGYKVVPVSVYEHRAVRKTGRAQFMAKLLKEAGVEVPAAAAAVKA